MWYIDISREGVKRETIYSTDENESRIIYEHLRLNPTIDMVCLIVDTLNGKRYEGDDENKLSRVREVDIVDTDYPSTGEALNL